jgi:large subunit ribosomal protein LP0
MVRTDKRTWKANYFTKFVELCEKYPRFLLVNVDNVGSKQMQEIRISMRGKAEILLGKNTMMRKIIRTNADKFPDLQKILPHMVGNVGLVFTDNDLNEMRDLVLANRRPAMAKAGSIAPVDVMVPAGSTGQPPDKTSFFQALGITTKIAKGLIEIAREVHLIHAGDKVGLSEATLLKMLKICPFTYGLAITQAYDSGSVFGPAVLDISKSDIISAFKSAVNNVAAFSLATGYPTVASVPHSIANSFKNILAVAVACDDISFPAAEQAKAYLKDPSAFASAAPAAAAAAPAAEEKKVEAKKESSSEDGDMGFGLFD